MSRTRQFLMAGGTFSVALGIGFVMQNGDALAGRFAEEAPARSVLSQPVIAAMPSMPLGQLPASAINRDDVTIAVLAAPVVELVDPVRVAATMPKDIAAPSFDMDQVVFAAVETGGTLTDALPETLPVPPSEVVALEPVCDATLTATAAPAAMVDLSLSAPCSPEAAVVIHHQGMMFTILTDSAGLAQVSVPALAEGSVFVAELANGKGAAASIIVPELAGFDRAVLQWQGAGGMELHALEFGASYADAGHVWSGAARDAATALAGEGGFITRLGDDRAENALIAEVYTFPSGTTARDGTVDLSVEAEVTAANCGRDVAAQSIQIIPGTPPSVVDLTMTMPDCASVGEFLVLDTMLQDLTVAAN